MLNDSTQQRSETTALLIRRSRVRVPAGPLDPTGNSGEQPPRSPSVSSTWTKSLALDSVIAGPPSLPARIADRLIPEPNTGCLLWEGCTDDKGYGLVWWRGRKTRVTRVVLELKLGRRVRRDREALHSCDTPGCANDVHLSEGTRKRNARERQERGRTRGCIKGAA